jgi:hypothetical protein
MPFTGGALLRAYILMVGLLALTLTTFCVPHASAAVVPAPTADRYGINAAGLSSVGSADLQRTFLPTLVSGGVRVVRFDLSWGRIEQSAPDASGHHYDWSGPDRFVADLAQAGLRGYPIIDYSAPWASIVPGDQMSRPRDPMQFAAFAAAGMARYGTGGSFWAEHPGLPQLPAQTVEIWNEPNAEHFWREQATAPRDYAALYLLSRAAIHAVAPTTQVVVGGLVERTAATFLRGMFAAQPVLKDNLDGVGYHVYLLDPATALGRIRSIRTLLDRLGAKQTPIELTEVGWSLLEATEAQRGENLAQISRLVADPALRVTRVIPYCALSIENNPQNWEEWFGLINKDGSAKPAFTRWATEIGRLNQERAVVAATPRLKLGAHAARASGTNASVRSRTRAKAARTRASRARLRSRAGA